MTRLLERAFESASMLPDVEQNVLAKWLMEELESERRWAESFSESEDVLSQLADEALAAHSQGHTTPLNVEKL